MDALIKQTLSRDGKIAAIKLYRDYNPSAGLADANLRFVLGGLGMDEMRIGLAIGAIQANDQIKRMSGVHVRQGLRFSFGFPASLTQRQQYRRVLIELDTL